MEYDSPISVKIPKQFPGQNCANCRNKHLPLTRVVV